LLPTQEGVRVDSGVAEGDAVGSFYDPLLAKVIVHAEDRPAALRLMREALGSTAFLGLTTNIEFLQDLLSRDEVDAGVYDTRFVEREMADWSREEQLPVEVLVAAVLAELGRPGSPNAKDEEVEPEDAYSPWGAGSRFRIGGG
jgi:acetyl-CoA/propionyl-CoA carboxylase biotin carboxyl carrier protein